MIEHFLKYARLDISVFPVWGIVQRSGHLVCACGQPCGRNAGKHPIESLVPHGSLDATTDTETIQHWLKLWPDANIGIRLDRYMAVDVDPRHGGDHTLVELQNQHGVLPNTRRVKTGSGGWHIIFRLPDGIEIANCNGKWPGIDIKTGNGYIVAPPSLHVSGNRYRTIDDIPAARVPAWLVELLRKKPEPIVLPAKPFSGQSTPYGLAALDGECRKLAQTVDGNRNGQLNISSLCLHRLVAGGELDRNEVEQGLLEACQANGLLKDDGLAQCRKTIRSGARKGLQYPRSAPR